MTKNIYKRLLSKSFHDALTRVLILCEKAETPRTQSAAHMRLRETLEKVYPYVKIAMFPDDVLVDMAEVLQGMYDEQDDLQSYYKYTIGYLETKINDHVIKQKQHNLRVHLDELNASNSELCRLDHSFTAWLHNEGYYAQRNNMYELLLETITSMLHLENSK